MKPGTSIILDECDGYFLKKTCCAVPAGLILYGVEHYDDHGDLCGICKTTLEDAEEIFLSLCSPQLTLW